MQPRIKLKLCLPICLLFLAGISSCRKETTGDQKARIELLTGNKWILTNLYHQESGDNTIIELTKLHYKDCEMDDSYNFTKDNIFFRRDSTYKCGYAPQFGLYGSSSWAADSSYSKIVFTSMQYKYEMEIKTLTESSLELKHAVLDYFNTAVIYTYRFRSAR